MIDVEFNGEIDFNLLINELTTSSVNRVFRAFGAFRKSAINQQFSSNRNPYGTPQTPLNAAYEIEKVKKWGNKSILVASGAMKNSWNYQVEGTRYIEEFTDPKAVYHQYGTNRLPARAMLPTPQEGLSPADTAKILELANTEIERTWRRIGKPPTLSEIAQVTEGDVSNVLGEIAAYANR